MKESGEMRGNRWGFYVFLYEMAAIATLHQYSQDLW